MPTRDEELEKLFLEVQHLTSAVAANVHTAATSLDKLVLSPEFAAEFPWGLFGGSFSRSDRHVIVTALPNYRAYLDWVGREYPLFGFQVFIGYVKQRLIEIEASLLLLLTDDV